MGPLTSYGLAVIFVFVLIRAFLSIWACVCLCIFFLCVYVCLKAKPTEATYRDYNKSLETVLCLFPSGTSSSWRQASFPSIAPFQWRVGCQISWPLLSRLEEERCWKQTCNQAEELFHAQTYALIFRAGSSLSLYG